MTLSIEAGRVWSVFCRVVDNFGDMGVCWRLAGQLAAEHSIRVNLWVDDIAAMKCFVASADPLFAGEPSDQPTSLDDLRTPPGTITLQHWHDCLPDDQLKSIARSDVVVEAFGCGLPEALLPILAQQPTPPVWINLEYLSAEPWVSECHALVSPIGVVVDDAKARVDAQGCAYAQGRAYTQAGTVQRTLRRHFFFPGFTLGTGGLLRERQLLAHHRAWQAQPRLDSLRHCGLPDTDLRILHQHLTARPDTLLVSVFCYPTSAWTCWLRTVAQDDAPTLCLISDALPSYLLDQASAAGVAFIRLPFLSQAGYDRVLSVCDLNIVRGEDSFVRAQWAARPLIWHIYPQHDAVHFDKLEAFLTLYRTTAQTVEQQQATSALAAFMRQWNSGADCQKTWHYLRPQLPQLRQQARNWQLYLAGMPDLATLLVTYCGEVRSTSEI